MASRLDRLLSLGQSDALPARLTRHIRVTNALALLGVLLSLMSAPLDAYGGLDSTVVVDLVGTMVFGSCWYLNARGHHHAARVTLMTSANLVILGGVVELGADAELRTVFFPLVILPFLVLSISDRVTVCVFVALPVICYFATGQLETSAPEFLTQIYGVYAPALAFTALVTGSIVFANIDRDAEARLLQARAQATQSARLVALGEMSSGIAHEIRNPLAAIHLAATQIADHPADAALVAKLGERIQRVVMRASHIIENLRSFARDASTDPFVEAPVERILADTLELCAKRLSEAGVALTVDNVPADLVVECRPVQLSQVLVNLMSNAYDAVATAPERWVRVEVTSHNDQLEIAVTNSGPSIPAAIRMRMFEPFFTTKTPDRGTGLGLSLSRGLVEAHHGTLELDSSSAHTRFVMRIPRAQPAVGRT